MVAELVRASYLIGVLYLYSKVEGSNSAISRSFLDVGNGRTRTACTEIVCSAHARIFLREYSHPKKGTAIPGFEPSTFEYRYKTPMRYDALTNSATTAGISKSMFV